MPPEASGPAWRVFLGVERCALPLRARVPSGALSPGAARALEALSHAETTRALSGRAQLVLLSRLLAARGLTALVLKGGVEALPGGRLLDVVDVDLLVRPGDARQAARDLEERAGYSVHGADPEPGTPGTFHLAPRMVPGAVPVELHYALPYVAGMDPWSGWRPSPLPGLGTLAPASHLWHVLVHGVVHHSDRRGMLRELVLAASAAAACGAEEMAEVERRMDAHPERPLLRRTADAARALARGEAPEDPFRASAAMAYLLAAGAVRLDRGGEADFMRTAFALVEGADAYGRIWSTSPAGVTLSEKFGGATRMDRVSPALARLLRVGARAARTAAFTPGAWRLARTARRLAREAQAPD